MCVRILTLTLVVLALSLGDSRAAAQLSRGTVVLPVLDFRSAAPDARDARAERAADPVQAAMVERDPNTISLHDARDRFIARSRPPVGAEEGDVDALAREARAALEHVAFGRTASAQRSVKAVMSRAERALESLNRETATARQVLDACLALVRSALHRNDRREALDQATACRRLIPDVAPNQSLHPASVIGVLAEADDQLRRLRTGRLRVISVPESSCPVYVNGRHLGTTPFVLERAVTGKYRVQVECSDERGRVHVVDLGDEPAELRVDAQLDRAIVSDPRLALRYAGASLRNALEVEHATQVGRAVRSENVLLVRAEATSVVLSRVSVEQGRLLGRVRIPYSDQTAYARPALLAALDALWEGRIDPIEAPAATAATRPSKRAPAADAQSATQPLDEPVDEANEEPAAPDEPAASASNDAAPERDAPSTFNVRLWTGVGLSVLAAATFATGLAFEQRAASIDDELASRATDDPEIGALNDDLSRAQSLRWIGLGGLVATAAVPLLAKPRAQVPWWSYAISAVGVVGVGAGIYELATASECELLASEGFCIQKKSSQGRGGLLLTASVPLLSVLPTHFWLRKRAGSDLAVSAAADRFGTEVRFSMRFGGPRW